MLTLSLHARSTTVLKQQVNAVAEAVHAIDALGALARSVGRSVVTVNPSAAVIQVVNQVGAMNTAVVPQPLLPSYRRWRSTSIRRTKLSRH
jgi:hypothetical protein